MFSFFVWCILLVICWPLALLAVVIYPLVWLYCYRSGSWALRLAECWNW
jgi:hypothetical protein